MSRHGSASQSLARTALLSVSGVVLTATALVSATPAIAAPATPVIAPKTTRTCGDTTTGVTMTCFAERRTDTVSAMTISPNSTPAGYGPADLSAAYKLGTVNSTGTVAIVDAYDDPKAEADLAAYRTQYGLPACTTANGCFKKVNQTGAASPLPVANSGWAGEIALDIEMVSAVCPTCHILLVEANAASGSALYAAVDYAATQAKYVSNSWGTSEYSSEITDDTHFNHPGVVITVSTGDSGYGTAYPAASKYVTAVGGTSLTKSSSAARGYTETAWSGAGSGCSAYESRPTWQTASTSTCTRRAMADVSAVSDPNTGVAVYQTYGASGWTIYGGTSVAAPVVAAVYAAAGTPGATDYPAAYPYAHTSNLFDVTSGSNGSCGATSLCTGAVGWDGPTGLGSPNTLAAFKAAAATATPVAVSTGAQAGKVGTASSLTLQATGGTGTYTWTSSTLPAGLTLNSATGVVSGTPTTAGTFTVTFTATDSARAVGTAPVVFTIAANTPVCTSPGQKVTNGGFETGATGWTANDGVVNQYSARQPAHGGAWTAWLDGYGTTHTDTVSQSVTLPTGCTSYSLSFWLHVDTAESSNTALDKLTVSAGDTALATYSNMNKGSGYAQLTVNLAGYAGKTVVLRFTGTENGSLSTSFAIDDVSLAVA